MMRNLFIVCSKKKNMIPIVGDARFPERYAQNIGPVDVIYQDIAQPNQAEILLKNTGKFSPKYAMLAIKSRSINAVKSPKTGLQRGNRQTAGKIRHTPDHETMQPYDKDHVLLNTKGKEID